MAAYAFAWPFSLVTPLVALGTTVLLIALAVSQPQPWYAAGGIFAAHPAFMSAAFVCLLPLAVVAYVADCGRWGNGAYPDRGSRRGLHGTIALLGGIS